MFKNNILWKQRYICGQDCNRTGAKAFKQCYIQSTLTHVISQSGKVLIFLVAISSTVRFKWTNYHKHNFLFLGPLSSQPLSLIQDWTTFSASFTTFSSSDRQNTWRLWSWRREGSVVLWFVKFNQVEGKEGHLNMSRAELLQLLWADKVAPVVNFMTNPKLTNMKKLQGNLLTCCRVPSHRKVLSRPGSSR